MSEKLLSQTIGILSIIVVGHIEYLTSEKKFIQHFNSQKPDEWDVEQIGSWKTDLDAVKRPFHFN